MQTNNNQFTLRPTVNGDNMIAFTNSKNLKFNGYLDKAKVLADLMCDEDKSHIVHLGLIQTMEQTHNVQIPMLKNLFEKAQVLTVREGEVIHYDLPVYRDDYRCVTAEDTSSHTDYPGYDGTVFPLILNEEFAKGDVLTYDAQFGEQVVVSEEHEVEPVGENFRHWVYINDNDKARSFPKDKLEAGIEYFKIGHYAAEYSQTLSTISSVKNPTGTITNEFILGSPRGVETFYTRAAANMKNSNLNTLTEAMYSNVEQQMAQYGGADMFVMGRQGASMSEATVGSLLEYFSFMELARMEAASLMFAKGSTMQTSNGVKRINEGLWRQLRRGKVISYSRPGGITVNHLMEAANYIFGNSNTPIHQRRIMFEGGHFATLNVEQIIRAEALAQGQLIPAHMVGNDAQIPAIYSGPLDDLKMAYVKISEAYIPGLGIVSVKHNPSLDYQPFTDSYTRGNYGIGQFAHTTHSLVIWDATDPQYVNVEDRVKNAKVVKNGNKSANIYYVKNEGPNVTYGFEQGRMANGSQFSNVMSSMKTMARTFWCYNQSSVLMLDTTRHVLIELDKLTR